MIGQTVSVVYVCKRISALNDVGDESDGMDDVRMQAIFQAIFQVESPSREVMIDYDTNTGESRSR